MYDIADTIYMFKLIRLFVCISFCVLLFHSPPVLYGHPFKRQDSKKQDSEKQDSKKKEVLKYISPDVIQYARFNGQSAPSKDLLALLDRQTRWDDAGVRDQNMTGLRFNPSGFSLHFVKIDEQVIQGGRVSARYRVYAEGAPENKVYAFGSWPIDNLLSTDPRDFYVNGQGLLMLHPPQPEQEMSFQAGDDEFDVTLVAERAEPVRYLLSSRDQQLLVYGTLVLHPVVSEVKGCRLEVRVAQPDATAVLIIADRFPARAKIPLVLESEGVTHSEMLTTNVNGHAAMAVFPYVPGKAKGILKATAEGPTCLPAVVLPWGKDPPSAPNTPPR